MKLEQLNQERNQIVTEYNQEIQQKGSQFMKSKKELIDINTEILEELYSMNKQTSFYDLFRSALEFR